MISVAAAINSASTLFSIDILKRIKPKTSDRKLVSAGRITAVVIMVLAIAWSTQAGKFGSTIIHTVNSLGAMIAPPIVAVFLFGMFWRRGTAKAANVTFTVGMVLGLLVFLLDFPYENLMPGLDVLAEQVAKMKGVALHPESKTITSVIGMGFMMQAWWKFVLCDILFIGVSLITEKPTEKQTTNCLNL